MQKVARNGIIVVGVVTEVLPKGKYKIKVNEIEVVGTLSGQLRRNMIRIVKGDEVEVEMSPYDLSQGRIVYRHK